MSDLSLARQLSSDSGFIDRVTMAAVNAALNISAESPSTTNHSNRANLAQRVLMSPKRFGELMAQACAVNSTINAAHTNEQPIPDNDIEFVVASVWNAYAGSDEAIEE